MKWLCKLELHKWTTWEWYSIKGAGAAFGLTWKTRRCSRCLKEQIDYPDAF